MNSNSTVSIQANRSVQLSWLQSAIDSIQEFATLSKVLRILGASIVIASMGTFLLQEWAIASDISRFYLLLGQTLLLALVGTSMSFLLKENKGGRVFFSLSLVSITANMATLGALVFSIVQWGGDLSTYPDFAHWRVADLGALLLALAVATLVSIPIMFFAFSILVRQSAKLLTLFFVISNSLLLLPMRDSLSIAILATLGSIALLASLRKLITNDSGFRTLEGRIALLVLFLPVVIMIVRSFWLYHADAFLYASASAITFYLLQSFSHFATAKSLLNRCLITASIICALVVSVSFTISVEGLLNDQLVVTVVTAAFATLMLYAARNGSNKTSYVSAAGITILVGHALQLLLLFNMASSVLCIVAGLATIVLGKMSSTRYLLIMGVIGALIGLVSGSSFLFDHISLSSWVSMTALGIGTIVMASVLERYGAVLRMHWSKFSRFEQPA